MSKLPTIALLGQILCILGLAAAFPNDNSPLDTVLDTADQARDLGLSVVGKQTNETCGQQGVTSRPEGKKCKNLGERCFKISDCCTGRCHFISRKCVT